MRAAELRHRITIQQNNGTTTDSEGIPIENWFDVVTVWARIRDLSGREYFAAQQVQAEVSTEITIRYREGINTNMRVKYGSRIFGIQSIIPDERKTELRLMCKEVV
ncbi:phage head closure protein [Thermincola ferriacetica]